MCLVERLTFETWMMAEHLLWETEWPARSFPETQRGPSGPPVILGCREMYCSCEISPGQLHGSQEPVMIYNDAITSGSV